MASRKILHFLRFIPRTHYAVKQFLHAFCGHRALDRIVLEMRKTIHTPEYQCVLKKLVEMRHSAGMTQRELATRLEREHSFVWRIEKGERRLDLLEFFWVCEALGQDAETIYAELCEHFRKHF